MGPQVEQPLENLPPPAYRITVRGVVDPHWSDYFSGLTVAARLTDAAETITILAGPVPDQAALRGILNRLWDLNATLLSLEPILDFPSPEASHER
jgi:hypothetical protein